jgi:hypothetical protein
MAAIIIAAIITKSDCPKPKEGTSSYILQTHTVMADDDKAREKKMGAQRRSRELVCDARFRFGETVFPEPSGQIVVRDILSL